MKYIRLRVRPDGTVQVIKPHHVSQIIVDRFVAQKSAWIAKQRAILQTLTRLPCQPGDYARLRPQALQLVSERVEHWNRQYGCRIGSISIRNQKSRWGSCSRAGNLAFNYRVVHLDPDLLDYIIVHELCHLLELNHSRQFWNRVAQTIPDYAQRRMSLKRILISEMMEP